MKVIKSTPEYTILQRRDSRYAIIDTNKNAINGDDKVKILVAESLVTVKVAPAKEAPAESNGDQSADDASEPENDKAGESS